MRRGVERGTTKDTCPHTHTHTERERETTTARSFGRETDTQETKNRKQTGEREGQERTHARVISRFVLRRGRSKPRGHGFSKKYRFFYLFRKPGGQQLSDSLSRHALPGREAQGCILRTLLFVGPEGDRSRGSDVIL